MSSKSSRREALLEQICNHHEYVTIGIVYELLFILLLLAEQHLAGVNSQLLMCPAYCKMRIDIP